MKASILRAHFILSSALALLLANSTPVRTGDSCARLTDDKSPFRSSFAQIGGMFSGNDDSSGGSRGGNGNGRGHEFDFSLLESDFETIDALAPWLSQCAASVNVASVAVSIFASAKLQSCYAEIEEHVKAFDADPTSGNLFSDLVCPLYTETVAACVNDVLVDEILLPAIQDPCCNDLKSVVQRALGIDLPTEIRSLSKLVGNALCSTKTFADKRDDGQAANQTCGDALVATFVNSTDGTRLADTLDDALQIPTDQVCAAVVGKDVVLTSGKKTTFSAGPNGANFGICYQPMSELVDHVSAYPFLETVTLPALDDGSDAGDILLSALFTPDTCVPLTSVYMGLFSEDNFLAQAIDVLAAVMHVFEVGPSSSVVVDTWSSESGSDGGGDGDSVDDSDSGTSASISARFFPSTTGLGARMLRAAESWTILITTSGDTEDSGDGDPTDEDGSTDSEEPEGPGFTFPTIGSLDTPPNGDAEYFPICLHVPHGVPCDFGNSSITLAYSKSVSKRHFMTALRAAADRVRRLRQ